MKLSIIFSPSIIVATAAMALAANSASAAEVEPVLINPASMPRIAKIDPGYLSYNVEMAEVIGGNFWKPYTAKSIAAMKAGKRGSNAESGGGSPGVVGQDPTMFEARAPIDLSNRRLRKLAKALAPAYVRVSGSWANSVYFHDSDTPPPKSAPKGFQGVLTRKEWKNVIDFAQAVDAKLVTSFTISAGVRNEDGVWTPKQAKKRVAYTKSVGGKVVAAEFFNEPDMPTYGGAPKGYDAADYARDFAVFRKFARANASNMQLVGPGSVGEGVLQPRMNPSLLASFVGTQAMLSADPPPKYDVFSYHFYGAASIRCTAMGEGVQTTPEAALSEAWLGRADASYNFYVSGLRNRFQAGKSVWITEMADAACGGNPWAATFRDSFRFLDQLARLAKQGVKVVFHNTLASSEYGLLDSKTFKPRPNYWAALLWRRLMGTTVLDAGPLQPGVHRYAQCLRNHAGGVTLLVINLSQKRPHTIELPVDATRYTLTAAKLDSKHVRLNGKTLRLGSDDTLPKLQGRSAAAGRSIELKPLSITFLTMPGAGNKACR